MALIRSSKYRHVFGSPAKKENCYEGITITRNAHDSSFCAVNPKFIGIVTESAGGGVFLVLTLKQTGRVSSILPKVCGHRGPVTDIKWNPFCDNIIASCSDDATIKIWFIPDGGLSVNLSNWLVDLCGHSRRVCYIEWHPTAENILLSAGLDRQCLLWKTETGECIQTINVHPDSIFSISWNQDGSLFATTCKDKQIRVIDPRTGDVIKQGVGHMGSKASKVVFLDQSRLFTTGFSRMNERQFSIWDLENDLTKPLKTECVDASSGILIPYYDYDTKIVFLAGKGDGNIRYYEIVDKEPYAHYLSQYLSPSPQRGLGQMPKRGVDYQKCEIVRFYKLHTTKDICEPLSMIVPRKSELFQDDIYPSTAAPQPSLTADEWISGVNRDPILVSLKDIVSNESSQTTFKVMKPVVVEVSGNINKNVGLSSSSMVKNDTKVPPKGETRIATKTQESKIASKDDRKIPASLRNIGKLSGAETRLQFDSDRWKKKNEINGAKHTDAHADHSEPFSAQSKNELGERNHNGTLTGLASSLISKEQRIIPTEIDTESRESLQSDITNHDMELRKAFASQLEELQSLREQLTIKDKRIHQLEEEVKLLRMASTMDDGEKSMS